MRQEEQRLQDALSMMVLRPLDLRLRSGGWVRRGRQFLLRANDDWGMIRIQTTNQIDLDAIHVTANLGVHYGLLARWFGDVVEREPRFRDAHWVRRLGNLIGSGNDQWWVLVGDRGAATPPDPIVAPGQISDFVEAVASLGQSTITAHLDHDLVRGEWGRGDDWAIGSVRARLNAAIMAADVGDFNVARPLLDDLRADVQVVPELAPVLARLERHAVGQNGAP